MSLPISSLPASPQNVEPEIIRRSANYHPSIWGDRFLTIASEFTTIDTPTQLQFEELKEEVRRMLMDAADKPSQKLNLIDAIQRSGVFYHFESEIEDALEKIYHDCDDDNDLNTVALRFRLLRQHGYNISCDMFNKFKDNEGNFKESLICDVPGMLSLYEAAHLSIHGEDILDEALAFTTTQLESMVTHLSHPLAKQVIHALKQPIRKSLPRIEARHYLSIYQENDSHNPTLLKFAKLDFNILQAVHQKELNGITKWWKDLEFATKLPYARDRLVECYFWIIGVYFEPQYCLARRILTKVIAMTSIIDDTYDVYGILEELKLYTEAIERWEISATDLLPEYMKVSYRALLDVYSEIEEETIKEGRSYCVQYAKEAMKKQVRAYCVEAKWFHESYSPSMEEYMRVALVSCGYSMLATTSFVGMGEIATKEAFEWVSNDPKIVRASSIICRLMSDMVSHKFEQKRGHVASGVECCMEQHGISEQEVVDLFQKQVTNAWKDINQEFLKPTAIQMPLLVRALNLSRVIELLYKDDDGYTHVGKVMKDGVASLLIDPMPI